MVFGSPLEDVFDKLDWRINNELQNHYALLLSIGSPVGSQNRRTETGRKEGGD
jgi:hypothetical protein